MSHTVLLSHRSKKAASEGRVFDSGFSRERASCRSVGKLVTVVVSAISLTESEACTNRGIIIKYIRVRPRRRGYLEDFREAEDMV